MVAEPVLLHSTSALMGAMIVGGASLAAAIYSQWYQGRLQMMNREANKREAIYGEFIMSASKAVVKASITDNLSWTRDEQHLIGLINRMRLFAPPAVITEAEAVIRTMVAIALEPKRDLNELARTTLTDRSVPDLLLRFSLASQADLKSIFRPAGNRYFEIVSRAVAEATRYLRDRIARSGGPPSKLLARAGPGSLGLSVHAEDRRPNRARAAS
jgi:hypothetical protein